jgi:hypothetical protein
MFSFTHKGAQRALSGLFFSAALLGSLSVTPVRAQTEAQQNAAIAHLQTAITNLTNKVNTQQTTITALQNALNAEVNRAKQAEAALTGRATTLESKTVFLSANAQEKSTTFSGCNVYVNNGTGATNGNPNDPLSASVTAVNGLGNLIIGYNESGAAVGFPQTITGSHNLVLGQANSYTSYGGIVAGQLNSISGVFASIIGGSANNASGNFSSINSGNFNTASGVFGFVTGGQGNRATGAFSGVSGGVGNTAGGVGSVVSGGHNVPQMNLFGWAAGSEGAQTTMDANYRSP